MIDYVCTINIVIHTYKIGNSYLKAVKKNMKCLLIRSINPNINLYTNQHVFINFLG